MIAAIIKASVIGGMTNILIRGIGLHNVVDMNDVAWIVGVSAGLASLWYSLGDELPPAEKQDAAGLRCYSCAREILPDDDANVCIQCGGMNRRADA